MDARTLKKEDIQKETVYCLNDDDETEVAKEDTLQGMAVGASLWLLEAMGQARSCVFLYAESVL